MKPLLLAALLTACGPSLEQRELARTAATFASEVDPELRRIYEAELELCFTVFSKEVATCVQQTREKWRPVRGGLEAVRDAWCRAEPEKCR